jgi:transposase
VRPHVAYPAEASIRIHGVKRRAKTDKVDAKGLRELGVHGRVPESWIPPAQVLEIRTAVRLYHDLMTDRAAWLHLHSRDVVPPGRSGADATAAR